MKITKQQQEQAFAIIFENLNPEIYNEIVNAGNIQMLYERRRNQLLVEVFPTVLAYTIGMRQLFNQFLTVEQELRITEIEAERARLKKYIKVYRSTGHDVSDCIQKHNALVDEQNELAKGLKRLAKIYKQHR